MPDTVENKTGVRSGRRVQTNKQHWGLETEKGIRYRCVCNGEPNPNTEL